MKQLTFGSLFAGIGGFDLGLERAGMKCEWQVEIDPYARRILEKHWPTVRRWDDVTTFLTDTKSKRELSGGRCGEGIQGCGGQATTDEERQNQNGQQHLRHNADDRSSEWSVDVICGGFPCQDISLAGAGAGINGTRSGLWWEMLRIIRELRPRYVILENVSALLVRGLGDVLGPLAASGFDCEWDCIPAAAVGAPHRRDRIWIVATNLAANTNRDGLNPVMQGQGRGERAPQCSTIAPGEQRGVGNGEPNQDTGRVTGKRGTIESGTAANVADPSCELRNGCGSGAEQEEQQSGTGGRRVRQSCAQINAEWWATEPSVGRVAHGIPNRVDRLRGLGNAIVPQIAEWIGGRIVRSYNGM